MAVIEQDCPSFKGEVSDYPIVEAAIKQYSDRVCALAYSICQIGSRSDRFAAIDLLREKGMINDGTMCLLRAAFAGQE